VKATKHFLLVGHGGFYNRGCEAIVRCTVDIIKKILPDSSIVLSSYDSENDYLKIREAGVRVDNVLPAHLNGARKPSLYWAWQALHRRALWADFSKNDYRYRKHYKETDVVISIGGDNFSDDYGSPEPFFRMLDSARSCGAKTVIWGASVGPFRPPEAERKWVEYLKRINLITVREDRTVEYLANLGVTNNVQRVCDPAFLLPASEPKIPIAFDGSGHMTVGIGMSGLAHKYGIMEQYLNAFVGFIRHITTRHGVQIMLVPHVVREKATQNDLAVCQELGRRVNGTCRWYVLPETLNACEMKWCIAKCDYFIGARTHSTIASLSSCVPTISVGYSIKARGINRDLLGCEDYVVDIKTIAAKSLIDKFEQLRENRENIIRRLHVSMPRARENAERGGQYLLALVGGMST